MYAVLQKYYKAIILYFYQSCVNMNVGGVNYRI